MVDFSLFSFIFFFSLVSISLIIISFSGIYLREQERKYFLSFKILFIISMFLIILGGDLFSLFIGWEGLGITSFILIRFHRTFYCLRASIKTVIINRVGDIFFILSLSLRLFQSPAFLPLLAVAIFRKRAQFPISSWLPAAMAAPTPVRALVHSSTLVTAGIWLAIKLQFNLYLLLTIIGGLTILLGGVFAFLEKDEKKIVAFSTLSQLGLITFLLGVSFYDVVFLHLIYHAFFKSLLFVTLGFTIICSSHNQRKFLRELSCSFFILFSFSICLLSIIGVFFLSGFFSKHIMVIYICEKWYWIISIIFLIGVILTSLYRWRLLRKVFLIRKIRIEGRKLFLVSIFLITIGGGALKWTTSSLETDFSLFGWMFIFGVIFFLLKKERFFLVIDVTIKQTKEVILAEEEVLWVNKWIRYRWEILEKGISLKLFLIFFLTLMLVKFSYSLLKHHPEDVETWFFISVR